MTDSARPTSIRYIILALTVCVAVLLYLDRNCLGYVAPYINEGFGLTSAETGFILSAFYLTYAFGQLPGGWLADRYGTRLMLGSYLVIWSVLTGLTGFVTGFGVLVLLRLGCGLFEAGAYPASAGLIRRWIPYERRGLASAIVSLGGRIGGAVVPGVTAFLILVFVPVSAPSTIGPRDLLQPRKLAAELTGQGSEDAKLPAIARQAARRLYNKLPAQSQQFLIAFPNSEGEVNSVQYETLADIVNSLLKQPKLFEGFDLGPIKPKLNEQALALLKDPDTPASEEKTTRLNRYILEVLFPDSIRKILGDGWQPVLMIYGLIGILVAVVFFAFYRNTPREHFMTNEAEAALAEAHETATETGVAPIAAGVLWKSILTDVSLWANSIVQFGTNFGWVFLVVNLATYLQEVHQIPEGAERGFMASLPFLVSLPMLLVGGWWTDWMTNQYGRRLGRWFPIASTRFAAAAAFVVCVFLRDPWAIVVVLCVLSVVNDMGIPALWAYNLDVGKRNVGVVLGWGNMWGNLGAFVAPNVSFWLRNQFADKTTGYDAIFLTCAGVFVFIGFVSILIDATKPIGEKADDKPMPSDAIREGAPPPRPEPHEK